jgi:hypothetical protein
MTITWSLAYGYGQQQNQRQQKIHVKRWQFQWPCGYSGAMQGTSPNGVHLLASCKATRCCHRASARAVLPQRPPWLTILNETKKYQQNTPFTWLSQNRPTQKS